MALKFAALAVTAVLNASPAHMLTPSEGVFVEVTDKLAIDGEGFRQFLRHGLPWHLDATPDEALPEAEQEQFQLEIARLALVLVDSQHGADKAGAKDAFHAIVAAVRGRYVQQRKRAN